MFSFETAKKLEGKAFLSLTSLTVSEFEKLLVPFSKNCNEIFNETTRDPRLGGRSPTLAKMEDRLFFILFYLKTYPLQEVIAYSFGMSQGTANVLIHQLSHVLKMTLNEMGHVPARVTVEMLKKLENEAPQAYVVDGTERPIVRPSNPDDQKLFYSGKKKTHCKE